MPEVQIDDAVIRVLHDEDARVYINGVLAATLPGFVGVYQNTVLPPDAVAALKPGRNVIAVHCHQTAGGQIIDLGLKYSTR